MDDGFNDDMEFNSEEVQKIAKNAVEMVVNQENIAYQKDKVNQWCSQIIEACIKDLVKLGKQFKYVVTCIIMQNNGCGLQSATTAYWETKNDGLIAVQMGGDTFTTIVTIFAIAN